MSAKKHPALLNVMSVQSRYNAVSKSLQLTSGKIKRNCKQVIGQLLHSEELKPVLFESIRLKQVKL